MTSVTGLGVTGRDHGERKVKGEGEGEKGPEEREKEKGDGERKKAPGYEMDQEYMIREVLPEDTWMEQKI